MSATQDLFSNPRAFDLTPEIERLYFDAMGEAVEFHRHRSPVYDGICRQHGYKWGGKALFAVPHLIVTAFKENELLSMAREDIAHHFTSSGTGGSLSQVFLDEGSYQRQTFTRASIMAAYGLTSDKPVNYLCFSYDPDTGGDRGAAHTFTAYAGFAPARELFYAITRGTDGQPHFQLEACIEALERFAGSGLPLRVLGFPAFGYTTLKRLDEQRKRFAFPPESLMLSAGGWKLHTGEEVPFSEYVALVGRVLGIAPERVRDVFGMVEHGIPYVTCENGSFHVPVYSQVWAVDPGTLQPLPRGEIGLLRLQSPFIRSQPSICVLSTDWGSVNEGCACGRPNPYLKLFGRAGVKKYAGCAISAAQLLGQ